MMMKCSFGAMGRRGCVVASALWMVGAPAVVRAGVPGGVPVLGALAPSSRVELRVDVDPGIVEADGLTTWIEQDAREVLAELPAEPPRRGTVRVTVGGALYDYQVTIAAIRGGTEVAAPIEWTCECSNEELLERLRGDLVGMAELLEVEPEPKVEPEPEPEPEPVVEPQTDRTRKRLGPAGAAGVALMVMGATGIGTGAAFIAVGETSPGGVCAICDGRRFQTPGASLATAGAGLLLTGVTLFLLRDRINSKRRRTARMVVPSVSAGDRLALSVTGRF